MHESLQGWMVEGVVGWSGGGGKRLPLLFLRNALPSFYYETPLGNGNSSCRVPWLIILLTGVTI